MSWGKNMIRACDTLLAALFGLILVMAIAAVVMAVTGCSTDIKTAGCRTIYGPCPEQQVQCCPPDTCKHKRGKR